MKRNLLMVFVLVGLTLFAASHAQVRAEVALRAAMEQETVKGDLKGAIEAYRKIVDAYPKDRAVQAQALLRMAGCYQNLGDAQARAVYERIVREYQDAPGIVQQARAHLGPSAPAAAVATARRIAVAQGPETATLSGILMGSISGDGRYLSYTSAARGASDLVVRDLTSGTDTLLVKGGRDSYPDQHAISRDGSMVAYVWWNNDEDRYELRLISARAGAQPRLLLGSTEIDWMEGIDWAPDGKVVAAQLRRADGVSAIGLVTIADGSLRVLKSLDWRWTGKMFFSPDGTQLAFDFPQGETNRNRDVFVLSIDGSKETPAIVHGSNDRAMGWSPDGRMLLFISDRTGSDALWGMPFPEGRAGGAMLLKRDFSSDVAKGMTKAGALYYGIPYVSGFDLQVATFDFQKEQFTSAQRSVLNELVAAQSDFEWMADSNSIVYVSGRQRSLDIHDLTSGAVRELYTGLRGLAAPRLTPDGRAAVVRGVGERTAGSLGLFRVDLATGEATPLAAVSGGSQRADMSPDGNRLYFRRFVSEGRVAFVERDLRTGHERTLVEGDGTGLGWVNLSPAGDHLVTAGRDHASQSRSILLVSTSNGAVRELMRVQDADALAVVMWAPDSRSVFVRKTVDGEHELWRIPLAEGNPRQLPVDISGMQGPFRVSPDGRQVAFAVPVPRRPAELWVLENVLPQLIRQPDRP